LGKALVVTQIALSMVLLLGAGLLVRSFQRLVSIDPGFQKERVLEISLSPRPGGFQNLDLIGYRKQLIERISRIPGVLSVSLSGDIPSSNTYREAVSPTYADPSSGVMTSQEMVWPGFFSTLGIRLMGGRDFGQTDDDKHPHLAIVSNSLAKRLFPNGDAIGKSVRFGFMPEFQELQIVGVAGDARIFGLRDSASPILYLSYLQYPKWADFGDLLVRTAKQPESLSRTIAREIEALGHEYPLRTRTLSQTISASLIEERVTALLSGFFAALALLLACVGLYGLMSYAVNRRTHEIGVRVALGARYQSVLWIVLKEVLTLTLVGIAVGIPCALAASHLITRMLFGLSSSDLPTMISVSLLLLLVALLAGYWPAQRASRIDPMVALRTE
jgi:predicted permease